MICSHLLRRGGGLFACLRAVPSLLAPLLLSLVGWFGAVLIWAVLSLPSFVLGLVFRSLVRGPLLVVFSLCWCFCLRVCGCLSVPSCAFLWWLGLFVSVLCLAIVGSPPRRLLLLFPAVGALWRPGPVSTLVPPSGYLVAFCDGLVALPYCWGVVVLCRPHFILSHGSKGLCSCVGFVLPSTP